MAGNFRKGAEAAATASKGGANFAKTHYLQIEDGKSAIVRFLSDEDDWITVDQHNNISTKGKPKDHEGNWPEKMSAVCRNDVAFEGQFADCYICDNLVDGKTVKKPTGRTWALACLREEVKGDGSPEMGGPDMKGKVVGVRDVTRKVAEVGEDGKPTGKEVEERAVVVVNQGYKNFFGAMKGFAGYYGTVCDRDYLIKRTGASTDTVYNPIPMDPITMPDGSRFDTRNPEHAAKYGVKPDMLEDILNDRASDDFYARFFDRRVEIPSRKKDGEASSPAATPAEKPGGDVDAGRLSALADRVKTYGASEPATPTQAGGDLSTAGSAPAAGGMRSFE